MIFFTSDEHYGHANIIKYCNRPFKDVDHMTEGLIARHNARVGPDDVVWHLGDFTMSEARVAGVLSRLNGKAHYLIAGNHDGCHPTHKKSGPASVERYTKYGFHFVWLNHMFRALENDELFVLHHMPYVQDARHGQRYADYCPRDDGKTWLLHGHVHDAWKVRPEHREINVGVDVWDYAPVTMEEILARRATTLK